MEYTWLLPTQSHLHVIAITITWQEDEFAWDKGAIVMPKLKFLKKW